MGRRGCGRANKPAEKGGVVDVGVRGSAGRAPGSLDVDGDAGGAGVGAVDKHEGGDRELKLCMGRPCIEAGLGFRL